MVKGQSRLVSPVHYIQPCILSAVAITTTRINDQSLLDLKEEVLYGKSCKLYFFHTATSSFKLLHLATMALPFFLTTGVAVVDLKTKV